VRVQHKPHTNNAPAHTQPPHLGHILPHTVQYLQVLRLGGRTQHKVDAQRRPQPVLGVRLHAVTASARTRKSATALRTLTCASHSSTNCVSANAPLAITCHVARTLSACVRMHAQHTARTVGGIADNKQLHRLPLALAAGSATTTAINFCGRGDGVCVRTAAVHRHTHTHIHTHYLSSSRVGVRGAMQQPLDSGRVQLEIRRTIDAGGCNLRVGRRKPQRAIKHMHAHHAHTHTAPAPQTLVVPCDAG
jgi:hypothetical protein